MSEKNRIFALVLVERVSPLVYFCNLFGYVVPELIVIISQVMEGISYQGFAADCEISDLTSDSRKACEESRKSIDQILNSVYSDSRELSGFFITSDCVEVATEE